jgi:predicted CXXCH cytochrome family protein
VKTANLVSSIAAALFLLYSFSSPAFASVPANSNRTGENLPQIGMLRNVPSQPVHTNFALNTNSCASCHMTHTAAGGNQLFRPGRSLTCLACHDGTMGFLNVLAPPDVLVGSYGGSIAAGTFAVFGSVYSPSIHNVDLFPLTARRAHLFDAPGGRGDGTGERGAWLPELACTSCHAPHGSFSIRLLHFNPNQIAVRPRVDSVVYGVYGGLYQRSAATNLRVDSGVFDAVSQVWRYPVTGLPSGPWVYGYSEAHLVAGVRIPQYWTRIYHSGWDPNTVHGGVYADPTVNVGEAFADNLLTRHFTINAATGEVMQSAAQRNVLLERLQRSPFNLSAAGAAAAELRIDVAQGLQVRARAAARYQGDLVSGSRAVDFLDHTSYEAPAYNLFCSACHTDYLPAITAAEQRQRGMGAGIYSVRYRHSVNIVSASVYGSVYMSVYGWTTFSGNSLTGVPAGTSDRVLCVSCHFAHGSDTRLMLYADGTRVTSGSGLAGSPTDPAQVDRNPSSALKRFINAAVCRTCHFVSR